VPRTQTGHDVLVVSHISVHSGLGTLSLGPASTKVSRASTARAAPPTNSPDIPAQVTDFQATGTVQRILHNDGTGLVGAVEVNCTIESLSPTVAQRFRNLATSWSRHLRVAHPAARTDGGTAVARGEIGPAKSSCRAA